MRKERMNNKGFSLVELIIVIAIMAILAAALAPQLMKYIEKSRVSTDASTCTSIESCVNAALADETIYKDVADKASSTTATDLEFWVTKDGSNLAFNWGSGSEITSLKTELNQTLKSLKEPKQTGMKSYKVSISLKKGTKTNVGTGGVSGTAEDVKEVGEIKVQTSAKQVSATTTTP